MPHHIDAGILMNWVVDGGSACGSYSTFHISVDEMMRTVKSAIR